MTVSGTVVRRRVAIGSKFEREALCIVSDGGEYLLRKPGSSGAPDYIDPEFAALTGKTIRVDGTVNQSRSTFFVSHWEELL